MRVLIADDQRVVREGLATIVAGFADTEVVGLAADGIEAVELVSEHRPDVVLMDLRMPRMDGVDATTEIWALHSSIPIVVLTTYADDESVLAAVVGRRSRIPHQGRRPGRHPSGLGSRCGRPGRPRPGGPGGAVEGSATHSRKARHTKRRAHRTRGRGTRLDRDRAFQHRDR
jgi:CheY-like chemotaxis protein